MRRGGEQGQGVKSGSIWREEEQLGSGSLRLRGKVWWITYYAGGRPIAESSGSTDKEVASNLLKQRLGNLASGQDVAPTKATIADLCALVFADYRLRYLRGIKVEEWRYNAHVKTCMGIDVGREVRREPCAQVRGHA